MLRTEGVTKYKLFFSAEIVGKQPRSKWPQLTFFNDSFPEWPLPSFESLLFGLLRHKL
jgi:hypothetical protein